ncbi:MAG: TlyA family RNA methyltransferase [Ruminococcus sp.]|nr:TlyA family RNA methyltransferase [Ruminococcus sp.]
MKTRLDVFLNSNGYFKSRTYSQRAIEAGEVLINGKVALKPSLLVDENDKIVVTSKEPQFVGRGGYKLKAAVESFGLKLKGLVCADLGASTGGFTDCLLQNGAKKVYAVDVGKGQLDKKLLQDKRVVNIEGVNVKDIDSNFFEERMDFVCADLSFISVSFALKPIKSILSESGEAVILVKPQFEAGKSALNKRGIVKNKKDHIFSLSKICNECEATNLLVCGLIYSPIKGGDGNIEYLLYLSNSGRGQAIDIEGKVIEAFESLK